MTKALAIITGPQSSVLNSTLIRIGNELRLPVGASCKHPIAGRAISAAMSSLSGMISFALQARPLIALCPYMCLIRNTHLKDSLTVYCNYASATQEELIIPSNKTMYFSTADDKMQDNTLIIRGKARLEGR